MPRAQDGATCQGQASRQASESSTNQQAPGFEGGAFAVPESTCLPSQSPRNPADPVTEKVNMNNSSEIARSNVQLADNSQQHHVEKFTVFS